MWNITACKAPRSPCFTHPQGILCIKECACPGSFSVKSNKPSRLPRISEFANTWYTPNFHFFLRMCILSLMSWIQTVFQRPWGNSTPMKKKKYYSASNSTSPSSCSKKKKKKSRINSETQVFSSLIIYRRVEILTEFVKMLGKRWSDGYTINRKVSLRLTQGRRESF